MATTVHRGGVMAYTRTKARRCGQKMRHNTPAEARAHIARLVSRGAAEGALEAYQCGQHWHVGHRSPRHRAAS